MTKAMRTKAAIFLAVFYACVMLAPHAALAFNAADVLHCINDVAAAPTHAHDEAATEHHTDGATGTTHDHAGKVGDGASPPVACCGLFSVAAIPSDLRVELGVAPRVSAVLPMPAERLDGEGPGNINKPPRV